MKSYSAFSLLLILALSSCSQQHQPQGLVMPSGEVASDGLICSYTGSYFRVTDGIKKWEKYVGNLDSKSAKVECGEKVAAALIGSYFVFFSNGQIQDKFLGSFPEERRILKLDGDLAVSVMGSYMITARSGGSIVSKYVGTTHEIPLVAISKNTGVVVFGSTFLTTDGKTIQDKFVSAGSNSKLAVGGEMAAAMMGGYFVAMVAGEIKEKFIGARSESDVILAGKRLIAASMGDFFVVLDPNRQIMVNHVGGPGRIQVVNDIAVHTSANGRQVKYDLKSGNFSVL